MARVEIISDEAKVSGAEDGSLAVGSYGGGSSAENAGVRMEIVQGLSVVGSCWVVRES